MLPFAVGLVGVDLEKIRPSTSSLIVDSSSASPGARSCDAPDSSRSTALSASTDTSSRTSLLSLSTMSSTLQTRSGRDGSESGKTESKIPRSRILFFNNRKYFSPFFFLFPLPTLFPPQGSERQRYWTATDNQPLKGETRTAKILKDLKTTKERSR